MRKIVILAAAVVAVFAYRSTVSARGTELRRAKATAQVKSVSGRDLGTLTLTDSGRMIVVTGMLMYLSPGVHGIHIHTVGKCNGTAFDSAGGHWNPTMKKHGTMSPDGPHQGDLLSITVDKDSMAMPHIMTPAGSMLTGAGGLLDADGAAIIVHAGPDDNKTDPSGGSGARVACGVIKAG